jgi:cytochrome P450
LVRCILVRVDVFNNLDDYLGAGDQTVTLAYTDELRKQRRLVTTAFTPRKIENNYTDVQEAEARRLLKNLLENPARFWSNLEG